MAVWLFGFVVLGEKRVMARVRTGCNLAPLLISWLLSSVGNVRCLWTTPYPGSQVYHPTATKPSACLATVYHPVRSCWSRAGVGAWALYCYSMVGFLFNPHLNYLINSETFIFSHALNMLPYIHMQLFIYIYKNVSFRCAAPLLYIDYFL